MSDTPETLAAILAEMRDLADHRAADAGGERPAIELLRSYADRIEAAVEREREAYCDLCKEKDATIDRLLVERDKAIKESAHGNAAAMRSALNRVGHLAKDLRNITDRDTEVRADVNEIVDVCRAALAAPARNCDRYATADKARAAFDAEHSRGIVRNLYTATFDWLFAPAEGGDHA